MIQAYINTNTDYAHNGDMVLMPTQCALSAKLNGTWTVKLVHPIDAEGRWRYITDEAVIKMPSFNGEQLFRVYERKKSDKGVEAKLLPIFYDSAKEVFLLDTRPTYVSGQQALDTLMDGTAYQGESNISTPNTAYYVRKNLLECISGKDDNAFIKRWGGEAIYDNYKIILNTRAGSDNGVTVRYGLNMQTNGFEETVDLSGVLTRVYAQGYNGATASEPIDSPLIDSYPNIRCGVREYPNIRMSSDVTGEAQDGIIICYTQAELDTALQAAVEKDFSDGLDKPAVTIKAKMILLQNMEEYKDYQNLQSVSLGDTVHAFHTRLGITTALRVCELVYDAVTDKVSEVTLGDPVYSYFDSTQKQLNQMNINIANISGATIRTQKETKAAIGEVRTIAEETETAVRAVKSYFFHDDSGVHVTTVEDDATVGNNVLIDALGMAIRDGETDLATFGPNLIELGKGSTAAQVNFVNDLFQVHAGEEYDDLDDEYERTVTLISKDGRYTADGHELYSSIVYLRSGDIDPNGRHLCSVSLGQFNDNGSFSSTVALNGERVVLQSYSSIGAMMGNVTVKTDGSVWINSTPYSPYKENTSLTGVRLVRQGNIVVMNLNKSQAMTANSQFSLGTIPTGFRPKAATVIVAQYATTSTPVGSARLVANTNGSLVGQEASHSGTYVLYASACWITDDTIS